MTRGTPLSAQLASQFLAECNLYFKDVIQFCCVTFETFWALPVNEGMLDGDKTACVDCGVIPPVYYHCVCAVS